MPDSFKHADGSLCSGSTCPAYQREMEATLSGAERVLIEALNDLLAVYASRPGHDPRLIEKGLGALHKAAPWRFRRL